MLNSIITSKTRVKLLLKLFLNSNTQSHLRAMEREFGESTSAIRHELNRFEKAKLISFNLDKGRKMYKANAAHPLFKDIQSILQKMVGIDQIVERITSRIGNLEGAYLTGSFAEGVDSDTIELVLVGDDLDHQYIKNLVEKSESLIDRKIVYMTLTKEQMQQFFHDKPVLLIWNREGEKVGSKKMPRFDKAHRD